MQKVVARALSVAPALLLLALPAIVAGQEEPAPEPAMVRAGLADYSITLSTAWVPAGVVRLEVANLGNTRHNLRVEGYGVDYRTRYLFIGESDVIELALTEPGEYTVYCDVGFHAGAGMTTTLTVDAQA